MKSPQREDQDFFSVFEDQALKNILNENFQKIKKEPKDENKKCFSKLSFQLNDVEKFSQQIEKLSFGGISMICDNS
jgi:hypothetical protein